MSSNKTVVVGMSGGVDSSVAALLLKQQGYNVIGIFMKNWEEEDEHGVCQASKEYEDVVRVCEQIGIPYYSVNFSEEYWDNVFSQCLEEFRAGHTPNPDVLCNREIKFKALLEKALELGGNYLATGHYCQVGNTNGTYQLLKGSDPNKEQTYFLYMITEDQLSKVIFPIGHMHKQEVRAIAREHHLPTAEKKDSTGICFIGKRKFKKFLNQYIEFKPGNFETLCGKMVGQHDGVSFYTIGQRRGLAIGGPGDAWYVVGKDVSRNVVIVEQGKDNPSLFSKNLVATDLSWISSKGAPTPPFSCTAKVRYRQSEQPCIIKEIKDNQATVEFNAPQRAITPKQSVVFYKDDVCLGGGIIFTRS